MFFFFFYTTLMIIPKADKPTNGDDRVRREENEKKGAQDMPQHVSIVWVIFYLLPYYIITTMFSKF